MPLFFLHIRNGDREVSCDELGLEFPDAWTLYLETYCAARDIGTELVSCGRSPHGCTVEVMNSAGELVFTLPFSEALDHPIGDLSRWLLQ